ncbi:MAG: DUF3025 domain-containing protein [Betaproteobacteria bacterium]
MVEALPDWAQGLRWDWPWMAHLAPYGPAVQAALSGGLSVAQVLNDLAKARDQTQAGVTLRFVSQDALPPHCAYESFIFEQRACPSRDNLHDLFNGLTWLAYPRTKARLNQLQAAQIARDGVAGQRGALRDALTLFDENGAVLLAPPALRQALQQRAWQRLFVDLRPLWAQARLLVFGHALQEKLQQPRKAITAHVYMPPIDRAEPDLDAALAAGLQAAELAEKPYWPLPILGVPGWYLPNENISFYDDAHVFRPAAAGRQCGTA